MRVDLLSKVLTCCRFDAVLSAAINRIKLTCPNVSPEERDKFEKNHLSPFVAELAIIVDHEVGYFASRFSVILIFINRCIGNHFLMNSCN